MSISPNLSPIKNPVYSEDQSSSSELDTSVEEINAKGGRKKNSLSLNLTPSTIPNLFLDTTMENPEQCNPFLIHFTKTYLKMTCTDLVNSTKIFMNLPKTEQKLYIKEYLLGIPISRIYKPSLAQHYTAINLAVILKNDIKNHFEMRIQLFFLTLLTSYKTNIVFELFKTYEQSGVNNNENDGLVEAHSHLLPSLCYLTKNEQDDHFINFDEENPTKLEPKGYAAYSTFQKIWNSTVKLPLFVNHVDSSLEGIKNSKTQNVSFRNYCIKIININTTGKINPEKGMKRFLLTLKDLLKDLREEVAEGSPKEIVLDHYLNVTESCLKQTEDGSLFKKLNLNNKDKFDDVFYEKVQKCLQQKMNGEISIWKKIESLEKEAFKILNSSLIENKEAFIRCVLLNTPKEKNEFNETLKLTSSIIGADGWGYYFYCIKFDEITQICKKYIHDSTPIKIENDVRNIIKISDEKKAKRKPKIKVGILQNLIPFIKKYTKKSPTHIENIALRILGYFVQQSLGTYKIASFLNLNRVWADKYLNENKTFNHYVINCLEDQTFLKKCRALNQKIEAFVLETT